MHKNGTSLVFLEGAHGSPLLSGISKNFKNFPLPKQINIFRSMTKKHFNKLITVFLFYHRKAVKQDHYKTHFFFVQ